MPQISSQQWMENRMGRKKDKHTNMHATKDEKRKLLGYVCQILFQTSAILKFQQRLEFLHFVVNL